MKFYAKYRMLIHLKFYYILISFAKFVSVSVCGGLVVWGVIDFILKNQGASSVFFAIFVSVVFAFKKMPEEILLKILNRRKARNKEALELIDAGKLSEEANDFLREYVEKSAFFLCYGICADSEMRGALLRFHGKNQSRIGWHDLRRAYSKIRLINGGIFIKLSWGDHFLSWCINILFFLLFSHACLSLLNYSINGVPSYISVPIFLVQVIGSFVVSFGNLGYYSAKKIIYTASRCCE